MIPTLASYRDVVQVPFIRRNSQALNPALQRGTGRA